MKLPALGDDVRPLAAGYVLTLTLALLLAFSPFGSRLDNLSLDARFRLLHGSAPATPARDVVVVGIDQQTLARFREPLALWHPHLAELLRALASAGPRLIAFDVVLPDKSYEFMLPGYDRPLLAALRDARAAAPLVLAQTVDEQGRLQDLFAPMLAMAGADAVGLALIRPDGDGTVRRVSDTLETDEGRIPTLLGRMAQALGVRAGSGLIDYTLGPGFGYQPLQDVIDLHRTGDTAGLRTRFEGRAVLVGAVLPFTDRHDVSVPLAEWEPGNTSVPGVLIYAQALRSVLGSGLLRPPRAWLVAALVALASLGWWAGARVLVTLVVAALGLAAITAGATLALAGGLALPLAQPALTLLLAVAGRLAFEGVLAVRDRRRLESSFGRYVCPNVLRGITAGSITPDMRGERRSVCVLFSDIRDFTTLSETRQPEEVVALLNAYFETMAGAVHERDGTIDKFIGDGLMAFFGAPNAMDDPARPAFEAARDMLARLDRLNAEFTARGEPRLVIGVGLHLGEVVAGHIGSRDRHDYTAIGDTVNTASRIEGLTKTAGFPLLCSSAVARALGPDAGLVEIGERAIKGRAAVVVYGWRPASPDAST